MDEMKVEDTNLQAIIELFNFAPELIERYRCEAVKRMCCDHAKEYINSTCDLAIVRKGEKVS